MYQPLGGMSRNPKNRMLGGVPTLEELSSMGISKDPTVAATAPTGAQREYKHESAGADIGAGASIGATVGGTIGSIVPAIGTAVGGIVGGVVGGIGGGIKYAFSSADVNSENQITDAQNKNTQAYLQKLIQAKKAQQNRLSGTNTLDALKQKRLDLGINTGM